MYQVILFEFVFSVSNLKAVQVWMFDIKTTYLTSRSAHNQAQPEMLKADHKTFKNLDISPQKSISQRKCNKLKILKKLIVDVDLVWRCSYKILKSHFCRGISFVF